VEERKLKAKSINTALSAGCVALRWAHTEGLIASNPGADLVKFSGEPAKRGVLTDGEVKRLFEVTWTDERSRIGNALAMSSGLRAGEVLGLQVRDIGEDRLHVRHSWSDMDGLKGTKTQKERSGTLLPSIRAELLELSRRNPGGVGPTSFIFWSVDRADRPMDFHFLLDGLKYALLYMSLTDAERKIPEKVDEARAYWKSRKVVFHSWRHFFSARMADNVEARKVMLATGHANAAVFAQYADHSTEEIFQEVRTAATETFGKLLPFQK
jgi:integrase